MKRLLPVLLLVLAAAGCHSQQPTTVFGISYTATAPASCTTASPCQIEYSDAPQVNGACPTSLPVLGCVSALGASGCTHQNVTTGVTYCSVANTVQNGATSLPSVVITLAIPAIPPPPTGVSGSAAPSTMAEIVHDTSVQYALNKDNSLRIIHLIEAKLN
jgi:hypothetical protein